jgi:hypothetical protein
VLTSENLATAKCLIAKCGWTVLARGSNKAEVKAVAKHINRENFW